MARKVIEGGEEIRRAYKQMAGAAQAKLMRRVIGKAMRPTAKKLRAAAPRGDRAHRTYKGRLVNAGFLRRSIVTNTRLGRDKNRASGVVRPASEAWYGSLLEHGYRPGARSKKVKAASRKLGSLSDDSLAKLGDSRQKVPGNKWWSNAMQGEEQKIIERFEDMLFDEIQKAWAK